MSTRRARPPASSHGPWTQRQTRIYAGRPGRPRLAAAAAAVPHTFFHGRTCWSSPWPRCALQCAAVLVGVRSFYYCCAALLRAYVGRGRPTTTLLALLSLHRKPIPCLPALDTSLAHGFDPSSQGLTSHTGGRLRACSIHIPSFSSSRSPFIYFGYKYYSAGFTRP